MIFIVGGGRNMKKERFRACNCDYGFPFLGVDSDIICQRDVKIIKLYIIEAHKTPLESRSRQAGRPGERVSAKAEQLKKS